MAAFPLHHVPVERAKPPLLWLRVVSDTGRIGDCKAHTPDFSQILARGTSHHPVDSRLSHYIYSEIICVMEKRRPEVERRLKSPPRIWGIVNGLWEASTSQAIGVLLPRLYRVIEMARAEAHQPAINLQSNCHQKSARQGCLEIS
jgi:hypothetical protein